MRTVPALPDLPQDPEVVAFVLRIRSIVVPPGWRTVILLDDVEARESWHFNALDSAFAKIRDTVALRVLGGGASGKPH